MNQEPETTIVKIAFPAHELAAIDAWVARHQPPAPSRSDAVCKLVAGRLGSERPSTMLPDFITGRDIV